MSAFLKNLPVKEQYLAAGVYLSEAPYPLPLVTPVLIHTGKGGGGGGLDEPVRRLEGH